MTFTGTRDMAMTHLWARKHGRSHKETGPGARKVFRWYPDREIIGGVSAPWIRVMPGMKPGDKRKWRKLGEKGVHEMA